MIWISADLPADYRLNALGEPGGELAAALYFCEMTGADNAVAEWLCQDVGGCNGILDGKVDSDTPDRRHGVRRISDANESGSIPPLQAIHPYRQ